MSNKVEDAKINLSEIDIVYPVKKVDLGNEELTYSLRSVCANLPHRDVWIFGTGLSGINETVRTVPIGDLDKAFANVNKKLATAITIEEISDPFIFMMDDIYVMKPQTEIPYFALSRSLENRLDHYSRVGSYARDLIAARDILRGLEETEIDFEAHAPILFHKAELEYILMNYPRSGHRRSLYGNIFEKKPKYIRKDFKIYDEQTVPSRTAPYLSSADGSWTWQSKLREYVMGEFREKCKYER